MSKKNGMIGAIVGDMAGSRFKRNNHRSKDFELLVHPDAAARERVEAWKRRKMAYDSGANKVAIGGWQPSFKDRPCAFTQNTVIALAVAAALLDWSTLCGDLGASATKYMQEFARRYPHLEYGFVPGGNFSSWLRSNAPRPYNSWGNGAAMRVSACGWAGQTLDEVKAMSRAVTEVTHNHPEGIKGAEATAVATFLARNCLCTGSGLSAADTHLAPLLYFAKCGGGRRVVEAPPRWRLSMREGRNLLRLTVGGGRWGNGGRNKLRPSRRG